MVSVFIVNFNTTRMTNACIKSFIEKNKRLKYKIYILDNSTNEKFSLDKTLAKHKIKIIDNTDDKLFNFSLLKSKCIELNNFSPNKQYPQFNSIQHSMSIQWIIDNSKTNDILILDSDTIVKRDIDFINRKYITCADVQLYDSRYSTLKNRFVPFIQYFNKKLIKKYKVKYFDEFRFNGGMSGRPNSYDTGTSFFEDVYKISNGTQQFYKVIDFSKYIYHLKAGSWKNLGREIPNEYISNSNKVLVCLLFITENNFKHMYEIIHSVKGQIIEYNMRFLILVSSSIKNRIKEKIYDEYIDSSRLLILTEDKLESDFILNKYNFLIKNKKYIIIDDILTDSLCLYKISKGIY